MISLAEVLVHMKIPHAQSYTLYIKDVFYHQLEFKISSAKYYLRISILMSSCRPIQIVQIEYFVNRVVPLEFFFLQRYESAACVVEMYS